MLTFEAQLNNPNQNNFSYLCKVKPQISPCTSFDHYQEKLAKYCEDRKPGVGVCFRSIPQPQRLVKGSAGAQMPVLEQERLAGKRVAGRTGWEPAIVDVNKCSGWRNGHLGWWHILVELTSNFAQGWEALLHIHTCADMIPEISPAIYVKYVDLVSEHLPWFLLREQIQ